MEGMSMEVAFDEASSIVHITPPTDFKGPETINHARTNLEYAMGMFGDKAKGVVAHLPYHYINVEASLYYKENLPDIPVAMVGTKSFQLLIARFLLKITKPSRPMKVFESESSAVAWIRSLTS